MEIAIIALLIIAGLTVAGLINRFRNRRQRRERLAATYGTFASRETNDRQRRADSSYFEAVKEGRRIIDDTTASDLDLQEVYRSLNHSLTSPGSEYTYAALRFPQFDETLLQKRSLTADFFDTHEKERLDAQMVLSDIGHLKEISMYDSLYGIRNWKGDTTWLHPLLCILFFMALGAAVYSERWAPIVILVAVINIIVYFMRRPEMKSYLAIFKYIISMLKALRKLEKILPEVPEEDRERIRSVHKAFDSLKRANAVINESNGDLLSMLMDYINMVLHLDLIAFNIMAKRVRQHTDEIRLMYELIGELELAINVASYRRALAISARPVRTAEGKPFLKAIRLVHPLVTEAVPNDFELRESVLVTGSNASGKSTFLKAVAVNVILSQTIDTVAAEAFESSYFQVMSSMALRDNLFAKESYYMVEIKSLRRIVDAPQDVPLLCLVDEILRGTNTLERISASSVILKELSMSNCLCLAATHDIELTWILEGIYRNVHFRETVENGDVIFDYRLYPGRSETRNAIVLLGVVGFSDSIIRQANAVAAELEKRAVFDIKTRLKGVNL